MYLILSFILIFISIALIILAFAKPKEKEDISSRIKRLKEQTFDDDKDGKFKTVKRVSLSDVVSKGKERLSPLAAKLINPELEKKIKERLKKAGKYDVSVISFISSQLLSAIGFMCGTFLFNFLLLNYNIIVIIGISLLFGVLGYYYPLIHLNTLIDRRMNQIFKSLPDTIDLLIICIEAGMGLNAALNKIIERTPPNPLREELDRTLKEIQIGKPRIQALKDLSDRVNMRELNSMVIAIINSEKMGTSLVSTLKIQSEILRDLRWQRAQEMAMKAPVKLIFPMVVLIFPNIFLVIFGPLVLSFILGRF